MTQTERVIKYCRDFGGITSFQAYADLGITQLGARIKELEDRGIYFVKEWEESKNRYGETIRYKKYSLRDAI